MFSTAPFFSGFSSVFIGKIVQSPELSSSSNAGCSSYIWACTSQFTTDFSCGGIIINLYQNPLLLVCLPFNGFFKFWCKQIYQSHAFYGVYGNVTTRFLVEHDVAFLPREDGFATIPEAWNGMWGNLRPGT